MEEETEVALHATCVAGAGRRVAQRVSEATRQRGRVFVGSLDQYLEVGGGVDRESLCAGPECENTAGDDVTDNDAALQTGAADVPFDCAIVGHMDLHCVEDGGTIGCRRIDCFRIRRSKTRDVSGIMLRRTN